MRIIYTSGDTISFGIVQPLPIVNLPTGASIARWRMRATDFVYVYIRTPAGFEKWSVDYVDDARTAFKLKHRQGINARPSVP